MNLCQSRYRMKLLQALPSLRFLDNNKVTAKEKAITSDNKLLLSNTYKTSSVLSMANSAVVPSMLRNKPPDENFRFYKRKPGSEYGIMKYKYLGKHSEGNRFIKNIRL